MEPVPSKPMHIHLVPVPSSTVSGAVGEIEVPGMYQVVSSGTTPSGVEFWTSHT